MKRAGVMLLVAGVGAGVAAPAAGQSPLNEDFDCYQPGAAASSLPGWELWPDGAEGFVTVDQAFSGSNSLHLNLNTDVVRRVEFRDNPVTFSLMTYVPSESVGLEGYVIALSAYDGAGPGTAWSMQVKFDTSLGVLEVQFGGPTTPLIVDRWVELRAEIDLSGDVFDLYYDGSLWAGRLIWSPPFSPIPIRALAALDFYVHKLDSGPGMYIDDVVATEAGAIPPPTCGTACYADCDGSGAVVFFDFLCFQNHFAASDPRADCDQDDDLTFFDFLCFQNEVVTGC